MIDSEVRFFDGFNVQPPKNSSIFDFTTGINPPLGYPSEGGLADDAVIEDLDVPTQFSTFLSVSSPPREAALRLGGLLRLRAPG